ncbi:MULTISPECIES: glycosyltransferase [Actinoalloteichus]|uniref:glycosyltransferase n=1 Tax=Actinoalloteichus TaxID=65496 RepID=UPI00037B11D6|nr:glycosyltransferase [Actinoalloteichus spitiensis]
MKALIYAFGSRGDIQPYLALAHALTRAGHEAVLCASANCESYAADYGIEFIPRDDWIVKLQLEDPVVQQVVMTTGDDLAQVPKDVRKAAIQKLKQVQDEVFPRLLKDMSDGAAAAGDVDVVIHPHNPLDHGHQIAEKLGVPSVIAALHPHFVPSGDYNSQLLKPGRTRSPWVNRLSHRLVPFFQQKKKDIEAWRRETLGLPPRKGQHNRLVRADGQPVTVLHGFSPHVITPSADWPETVHNTGFWFLPAKPDWSPPAELVDFLEAGEKPVFVGFGSLRKGEPADRGKIVMDAIRASGHRAIVGTGWGGLEITDPPENVLVLDEVPYDWLFPRVRAAVHAGGTGTMNAALVAGVPQVACPFHLEQLYWADLAHSHGVSTPPIRQSKLDVPTLAAAIRQATSDASLAENASRLAEKLRGEDGTATAVRVLEQVHARHRAASAL